MLSSEDLTTNGRRKNQETQRAVAASTTWGTLTLSMAGVIAERTLWVGRVYDQ